VRTDISNYMNDKMGRLMSWSQNRMMRILGEIWRLTFWWPDGGDEGLRAEQRGKGW